MKKKVLSVLLSILMITTQVQAYVFADEAEINEETVVEQMQIENNQEDSEETNTFNTDEIIDSEESKDLNNDENVNTDEIKNIDETKQEDEEKIIEEEIIEEENIEVEKIIEDEISEEELIEEDESLLQLTSMSKMSLGATAVNEWTSNNSLPTDNGSYKLMNDVTISSVQAIGTSKEITIDLNGHVIFNNANNRVDSRVIIIYGILNLYDSDPTATHNGNYSSFPNGGVISNGGFAFRYEGAGVMVYNNATFNMYGGTIYNCGSEVSGAGVGFGTNATFNMYGGSINNCTSPNNGGGVVVPNSATFNMNGGTIENCKTTGNDAGIGWGGGVCVSKGGTMNFTGGTVKDCTATRYGGGVYCRGTLSMSGDATIDNCDTTIYAGGGLCVDGSEGDGAFTMTGGEIKNCSAETAAGGFFLCGNANAEITGGTISNNFAKTSGGGMYATTSTLTLGGDLQISGNTSNSTTPVSDNLYLTNGQAITVATGADAPSEDFNVGIKLASDYSGSPFNVTCDNLSSKFKSDDKSKGFSDNGTLINPWEILQDALSGNAISNNDYVEVKSGVVTLKKDIKAGTNSASLTINTGTNVTLDLNGHVIDRGLVIPSETKTSIENGQVIAVGSSTNLTIIDSNPNAKHKFTKITSGPNAGLYYLDEANGTLTVKGGVITGGNRDYMWGGAGVYVNTATLTLAGGTIFSCRNTNDSDGGGAEYIFKEMQNLK